MTTAKAMPMATANPPRVIEFTVRLNRSKTSTAERRESGIAVRVISVTRKLSRNLRKLKQFKLDF